MSPNREYRHARWHSRAGFLFTTLLVLLVMGAPFLVTRGLLTHGALFLPGVAGTVVLFGGPLIRLALASGRLDHRAQGRGALMPMQSLMRLVLAIVLFVLGARACGWIFTETVFVMPAGLLDYQQRELTSASVSWHDAWTSGAWAGAGVALIATFVLIWFARRKRLAGLSWLAGWLLGFVIILIGLGLVVGYSLNGAGALAALSAPLNLSALWSISFWGDAAAVSMLAIGAQMGIVAASGRGLPQRAPIGREARIIVAGVTFLVVLSGLAGLLLLSAICHQQGIVPEPEHAAPGVLILDVAPALAGELFLAIPTEYRPSARQVTLGWQFLVTLGCCFGAAALIGARNLLPRRLKHTSVKLGYLAAGVVAVGLTLSLWLESSDAYLPLITVMPALLAVIRVTMARRAVAGMRLVSVAFQSSRDWIERMYLTLTFRVVRPLLLLAVLAVALTRREYSLMLASFAIAFALMWVGSLQRRQRSSETGVLRVVPLIAICFAPTLIVAQVVDDLNARQKLFRFGLEAQDPIEGAKIRDQFEREVQIARAGAQTIKTDWYVAESARLLQPEQTTDWRRLRSATSFLALVDPDGEETLRLERDVLTHDEVAPFPRLDEAFFDHEAGEVLPLKTRLGLINDHIRGPRLTPLLESESDPPPQVLMTALVSDLRTVYGTGAPRTRELRRYMIRRATSGRSLLKPDAGPGVVYLVCFLLTAGGLAGAFMLGVGRERE